MRSSWMTGVGAALASLIASGCVTQSRYNSMLQQQQTLEAALSAEILADQVKIEQLQNGIRVRMSDQLLYHSGSVELQPKGQAALDKVAPQLASMAAQGNEIDVVGNTDDVPVGPELVGRFPTNWELAGARASIVVRHLQARGVDPRKLEAVSNGEYHPVAPNDTPAERAQNRRTELLLRPR